MQPTPWPDKACGAAVWTSTIRSPARGYSRMAVLPPPVISSRLVPGLSFTSDMGARSSI
jgi:hypothetical protein